MVVMSLYRCVFKLGLSFMICSRVTEARTVSQPSLAPNHLSTCLSTAASPATDYATNPCNRPYTPNNASCHATAIVYTAHPFDVRVADQAHVGGWHTRYLFILSPTSTQLSYSIPSLCSLTPARHCNTSRHNTHHRFLLTQTVANYHTHAIPRRHPRHALAAQTRNSCDHISNSLRLPFTSTDLHQMRSYNTRMPPRSRSRQSCQRRLHIRPKLRVHPTKQCRLRLGRRTLDRRSHG
jgi:hypothetical protein